VTHSLHRFGSRDDLRDDHIVFAMPARGINDGDAVELQREFLRRALKHEPVNLGDGKKGGWYHPDRGLNPLVHWKRDAEPDPEAVIRGVSEPSLVTAVFDRRQAAEAFVKELVDADLGLSVNISSVATDAQQCCKACDLMRHSVEYSLGFSGRTDRLPEDRTLRLSTMCGHGMISHALAGKMMDRVRSGRSTPEDAARLLARFCVCSVFNPSRAARVLADDVPLPTPPAPRHETATRAGRPDLPARQRESCRSSTS
jgi:hypothetical protein